MVNFVKTVPVLLQLFSGSLHKTIMEKKMETITFHKGLYTISTDKTLLDINAIHHFLSTQAYWSLNIPLEKVKKAIEYSLCFGLYKDTQQIGFARIISDFSTIAYLGDVYVINEYRNQGLAKWLIETVMQHPGLQGLRRWILLTESAHKLYRPFGWEAIAEPQKWMEKADRTVYSKHV